MINIAEKRVSLNLSQQELAKKIGVTDSAICQYETGKRSPNIDTLKKLAKALDCSVDDLIKEKT